MWTYFILIGDVKYMKIFVVCLVLKASCKEIVCDFFLDSIFITFVKMNKKMIEDNSLDCLL
jgi:hypothetical protein